MAEVMYKKKMSEYANYGSKNRFLNKVMLFFASKLNYTQKFQYSEKTFPEPFKPLPKRSG